MLNYHMVWSVKYRRKILNSGIEEYLKELVQQIAEDKGFTVHLFECGEGDHVHCFVTAPPKLSITAIVKYLKGITGRKLFERFPKIRNQLWRESCGTIPIMWKRSDLYLRKISAVILNIRASRIKLKRTVNTGPRYCLRGGRGMLLSHRTSVKIRPEYSNIIGHMCYAASKLWNICNYERHHYKELGLEKYPDWYYQKKTHKGNLWYKQLPSQTAQETCKQLDKAWKSFYVLKKTGGIKNPNPPRFKQGNIPVTYMQMGIRHEKGSDQLRLSLPKDLKSYMEETYGIHDKFLYLENKIFRNMNHIKQLRIYPPENGKCDLIVIYEMEEPEQLSQNGHYLSIDPGLHNLMTCYDSGNGRAFILGRKYLSLERYFHKEIARVQSVWYAQQSERGIKYPKTSEHIQRLYRKKQNTVKDYLHKVTRWIAEYCRKEDIRCVVVGDIRNIRKEKDMGHKTNQKLHSLPYNRLYIMLEYKLKRYGIQLIKQEESYTSQCSPLSPEVSKRYAEASNRKVRGMYITDGERYNADAVGAFNILRKYLSVSGKHKKLSVAGLKNPEIVKVAA